MLGLGGGAALLRADFKAEMAADEARQERISRQVMAIAGKRKITVRDFRCRMVRDDLLQLGGCGGNQPEAEIQRRLEQTIRTILHALIEEALIAQEYERRKLPRISTREIDAMLLAQYPGKPVLEIEELHRRFGPDLACRRLDIATGIALERMEELELPDRIAKRFREVESYYAQHAGEFRRPEEVQIQICTLDLTKDSDGANADRILTVERSLDEGREFGEIVRLHSGRATPYPRGRSLWVSEGTIRRELWPELLAMRNGDIRGPLSATDQLYWIRRSDHHAEGIAPLEEVRGEIERQLAEDEEKRWRAEYRARGKVVIFDDPREPESLDAEKSDRPKLR